MQRRKPPFGGYWLFETSQTGGLHKKYQHLKPAAVAYKLRIDLQGHWKNSKERNTRVIYLSVIPKGTPLVRQTNLISEVKPLCSIIDQE